MGEGLLHIIEQSVSSPFIAVPVCFIAGLLTSFTPCVYPLIPVTAGYIGTRKAKTKLQSFLLSFYYISGLAITYASLGAFAALTGSFFGSINSSPYTLIFMGNLCLLFSLSMFGIFNLQTPAFISNFVDRFQTVSGYFSALIVGALSGLVAAPCTAPILGIILAIVATGKNTFLGVLMLVAYAFGMGFLLLIIGTFAGILSTLPKSGRWMEFIKYGFAVVMLLAAEYFLIIGGKQLV
ncbi:MAG: cytochrome c biogenesis protein CcdA [bacterium]